MKKLERTLAERDALFHNATLEAATEYWHKHKLPPPVHPNVPLAMVHKARLQWLDATDAMLKESMEWLTANGYETTMRGAPPLTPKRRDADRKLLGMLPLTADS